MEAWSHFVDCFSSRDVKNETRELTSSLASQAEWKRPRRIRFILAQGATPSAQRNQIEYKKVQPQRISQIIEANQEPTASMALLGLTMRNRRSKYSKMDSKTSVTVVGGHTCMRGFICQILMQIANMD